MPGREASKRKGLAPVRDNKEEAPLETVAGGRASSRGSQEEARLTEREGRRAEDFSQSSEF